MPYRELGVIALREVWRRYSAGEGVRAIARGTGIDQKTVAKYVAAAVTVGLHRRAPPPTEDQLAAFVTEAPAPSAAARGRARSRGTAGTRAGTPCPPPPP